MTAHKLPKEWGSIKFGDFIQESFTGLVKSAKEQSIENPYDYLKMNNLNFDGSFDLTNMVKVEATESEVLKYSLRDGDFLFNTRNSVELVGKCGVFSCSSIKPMLFNNNLLKVRFIEVIPEIVAHWFNSPTGKQNLRDITSATTSVAAIYQKQLIGLDIPVPPLAEQKVIADKLDSLLAQVETTKARLDRVPDILKRFRQSVLAAAVSGQLTEEWRGSAKLADWASVTLKEVAEIKDPHPSHRTPKVVSGGVPYIGIGDLKNDGSIDFESARKVSVDILKEHNKRYVLKEGDFVFGKIGTLGKATVLPVGIDYTLSANVILIQPILEKIVPTYLMYFLSSPSTMAEVAKQANSTSQAAFGIKKMRSFVTSLPTIEEQTEIVRRVEELFAFADVVEQKAQAASERVNKLAKSILAKAFRGELTTDWRVANPDLISGENSAEALLEKIKTEREALKPKKKTRAKKVKG